MNIDSNTLFFLVLKKMKGGVLVERIPKPASTVILLDQENRVYLTKRPQTMKFLGGFFVFPGGAVEREDAEIHHDFIRNHKSYNAFSPGHYIAAARELFEEVGVLLATRVDGSFAALAPQTERAYRHQLLNGEISFIEILHQEKLFFDFNHLTYFGHRVTPTQSPIRFDTRFFLAKLPHNQTPKPDEHEIDEALWVTPQEGLAANQEGKMLLAPPTVDSLQTILNHHNGGELMLGMQQQREFPFEP